MTLITWISFTHGGAIRLKLCTAKFWIPFVDGVRSQWACALFPRYSSPFWWMVALSCPPQHACLTSHKQELGLQNSVHSVHMNYIAKTMKLKLSLGKTGGGRAQNGFEYSERAFGL